MSEENVAIVRRAIEAWNRDDIEALAELFAPDAIWYPLTYWPDSQICHGREEIERLVRSAREPLERNEAAVEKLVEAGDTLVVAGRWGGVVRGTEDEIDMRLGMTLAFRGGKISEWRMFRTFDQALEAAGLRE